MTYETEPKPDTLVLYWLYERICEISSPMTDPCIILAILNGTERHLHQWYTLVLYWLYWTELRDIFTNDITLYCTGYIERNWETYSPNQMQCLWSQKLPQPSYKCCQVNLRAIASRAQYSGTHCRMPQSPSHTQWYMTTRHSGTLYKTEVMEMG